MRVRIEEVSAENRVRFSSDFGTATGHWFGSTPQAGDERHVELDTDDALSDGVTGSLTSAEDPKIVDAAGGGVEIRARLESFQSDCAVFALATSRFMLEVAAESEPLEEGRWYDLRIPTLQLHDSNL